jgi:hypothetical protein
LGLLYVRWCDAYVACYCRLLEFKEVQRLRELPKLIILDLVGNGVCAQEEYRLYVVFNVRKLKVRRSAIAPACVSMLETAESLLQRAQHQRIHGSGVQLLVHMRLEPPQFAIRSKRHVVPADVRLLEALC